MSAINELIAKKRVASASFSQAFAEESDKLEAAYALMKLREEQGLTQQQLADKAGKPQSTIARIENANMNVTVSVLGEIARSAGKHLKIAFV
jgi:ribosome-binding protein aMBF1 (putative translation factor)